MRIYLVKVNENKVKIEKRLINLLNLINFDEKLMKPEDKQWIHTIANTYRKNVNFWLVIKKKTIIIIFLIELEVWRWSRAK